MKFSICSWIFGDQPIEDVMTFVSKVGYDEIEVHAAVDAYDPHQIKQHAVNLGLDIRGLSADAGWPQEDTDLSHLNPDTRKAAIDHFKRQIDVAHNMQADYLVLSPCAPGKAVPLGNGQEDWDAAIASIRTLASYADERGVDLMLEPLNRYESCLLNNARQGKRFVEEVNAPNVKTMLDTFHMNIEETNLKAPFVELGDALGHIHVADTNRGGLGRGRLPFDEVVSGIQASGYDGTMTLECLAPGVNPFEANKKADHMTWLDTYAEESLEKLHQWFK